VTRLSETANKALEKAKKAVRYGLLRECGRGIVGVRAKFMAVG
jgi:hypothetical protein